PVGPGFVRLDRPASLSGRSDAPGVRTASASRLEPATRAPRLSSDGKGAAMNAAQRLVVARTLVAILALLLGSGAAFAQSQFDGALAGTVVDNVGVVPGA